MEIYVEAITPLGVRVRTTKEYWEYILSVKHRLMKGKEDMVKEILMEPNEIYRSQIDQNVFLYPPTQKTTGSARGAPFIRNMIDYTVQSSDIWGTRGS